MTKLTPIIVPQRPRVLALANQKGGVGKTTTAINLGTALAAIGEKVLIVDLDPQGNASTGLGIDRTQPANPRPMMCCAAMSDSGRRCRRRRFRACSWRRRRSICSASNWRSLAPRIARMRLKKAIDELVYDQRCQELTYILIDCPPSLSLITINAMTAADAVLVPLQCEFFALEGLSQLLKTVEQVRQGLNPRLIIQGVVLTMYDPAQQSVGPGHGRCPRVSSATRSMRP